MPDGSDGLDIELGVTLNKLARGLAQAEARMAAATKKMEADANRTTSRAFDGLGPSAQRAARQAEVAMTDMQRRIAGATGIKSTFSSAEESARAFQRALGQRDGVDRLHASLDPLVAAEQRLAAGTAQLETAVQSGAITDQQAAQVKRLLTGQYELATQATAQNTVAQATNAAGFTRYLQIGGAGRFVLQNTAAQISDIAVQLQMGTAASKVAGQQIPQLAAGFGALGGAIGVVAPILGVLAAVGIPAAAMMLTLRGNTEEAEKEIAKFADKLDDARGALSRAQEAMATASTEGIETVLERFKSLSVEVVGLTEKLADLERFNARKKVGEAIGSVLPGLDVSPAQIRAAVADYQATVDRLQEVRDQLQGVATLPQDAFNSLDAERRRLESVISAAKVVREQVAALQDELDLLPPEADALALAFADVKAALQTGDFNAVAQAIVAMQEKAAALGMTFDDDVAAGLIEAEALAREAAATLDDAKVAAEGTATAAGTIGTNLGSAVSAAASLAVNLGISLETARKIAALGPQGRGETAPTGGRGDPRDQGGSFFDWQTREGTQWLADWKAPAKTKSGGGSTSKTTETPLFQDVEKQIVALQRQIEMIGKTSAEVAELTARYTLLDEAKRRKLDLDKVDIATGETIVQEIDRQAAAIGDLTRQYEQAAERADFMKGLKDDVLDIVTNVQSLNGVLADLARQLARAAAQALLFGEGPLASLFGGTPGKGILSFIPGFATGGFTGSGGRGETAGIVHRGEYVFDQDATRRIGVANLDAMAKGLRVPDLSGMIQAGPAAAPQVSVAPPVTHVHTYIVDDYRQIGRLWAKTPEGQRDINEAVIRNRPA